MIFKYNTAEIIITVNIAKISGIAPIPELITPANKYNFAIKPDLAIYFDIDPKISMERICANRAPKFYEAGMDLKLSNDPYESYMIFQGRVIKEYQKMVDEFGLVKLDATDSIHSKQVTIRQILKDVLNNKGVNLND